MNRRIYTFRNATRLLAPVVLLVVAWGGTANPLLANTSDLAQVYEEGYWPPRRTFEPMCMGSGTDGARVYVVLALRHGDTRLSAKLQQRFDEQLLRMDDLLADAARRQNAPLQRIRFATNSGAPGCKLLVISVQLPESAKVSLAFDRTIEPTILANPIVASLLPKADSTVLVVYPSNDQEKPLLGNCGVAFPSEWPRATYLREGYAPSGFLAYSYCLDATSFLHELIHSLGAVDPDVLGALPDYHCTSDGDIMCYGYPGEKFSNKQDCQTTGAGFAKRVDCKANLYYNLKGPIVNQDGERGLNIAESAFLQDLGIMAPEGPQLKVSPIIALKNAVSSVSTSVYLPRMTNAEISFEGKRCYTQKKLRAAGQLTVKLNATCLKTFQGPAKISLTTADFDRYWAPVFVRRS